MAQEHSSQTYHDYPEVVPVQANFSSSFATMSPSDHYEYYEPPPPSSPPTTFGHRSPVPEYQPRTTSPQISSAQFSYGSEGMGSPPLSDSGYKSPPVQYSEIYSPDPQRAYDVVEKEYVPQYMKGYADVNAAPVHRPTDQMPIPATPSASHPEGQRRKPWYRRWLFIVLLVLLVVVIAVAVPIGIIESHKKMSSSSSSSSPSPTSSSSGSGPSSTSSGNTPVETGDININVGGYLSPSYYSSAGAWNGSGVAISAANPDPAARESIYAFYQDYTGEIQYTVMRPDGSWDYVGTVNDASAPAMNGTPLSVVNHQITEDAGLVLVWHLFYVDQTYMLRERILSNLSSSDFESHTWNDGPLNDKKLHVNKANTIGMQACYWGNYYGQWSYSATEASAGIHIWYASSSTAFQQYSWTNGSNEWSFDQTWNDLDGHAGVGCQTWDSGMTEYVFFVDTKRDIAMYWKDNNQSATATSSHPINAWTAVNISITDVQESSSLGYTNYMIYQADDASIRGANVTWAAEDTQIASKDGGPDTWVIQDTHGGDVEAIRGTHLSITVIGTQSGGALLTTFFQTNGSDMSMYTRDDTRGSWSEVTGPVPLP